MSRNSLLEIGAISEDLVTATGFPVIIFVVPRVLILGPLLFNINIYDLFSVEHCRSNFLNYFSNYADDTTQYYNCSTILEAISDLEIIDNL